MTTAAALSPLFRHQGPLWPGPSPRDIPARDPAPRTENRPARRIGASKPASVAPKADSALPQRPDPSAGLTDTSPGLDPEQPGAQAISFTVPATAYSPTPRPKPA